MLHTLGINDSRRNMEKDTPNMSYEGGLPMLMSTCEAMRESSSCSSLILTFLLFISVNRRENYRTQVEYELVIQSTLHVVGLGYAKVITVRAPSELLGVLKQRQCSIAFFLELKIRR